MSFAWLIAHNVWVKRVRSILTALAVSVAVVTVLTLGTVTDSIRTSAAGILQVGAADFTVSQRGTSDILQSALSEKQLAQIQDVPGVRSAIGVLLDTLLVRTVIVPSLAFIAGERFWLPGRIAKG